MPFLNQRFFWTIAKTTISYPFLPLFFFFFFLFCLTLAAENTAYPMIPGTEPTNGCMPPVERRPVRPEVHGGIYDITHRITNCMPVYADQVDGVGVLLWLTDSMKNGSLSNISELGFSSHKGHILMPLAMFFIIIILIHDISLFFAI